MRYAVPVIMLVLLASLIALSPHIEPQRVRARARRLAEELRVEHGFREGSKASWKETRASGWPPFHYGGHQELDGEQIGALHGLPVRVAGYETVTNGTRHRYGLAAVVLPRLVDWMEIRGERPFSAARVADHVPDGQRTLGVAEFDAHWSVYAETPDALLVAGSRRMVDAMLEVPTRFSWRTHEHELLLWKRDGWWDAPQLLACLSSVLNLLELADYEGVGAEL